jgi:diamine N-acetyltransferase
MSSVPQERSPAPSPDRHPDPPRDSRLRLVPVTAGNLEAACAVAVRPDQERFVEPVTRSLAEAYVHQDIAWPRLILDGERAVGFVMAFFDVRFYDNGPAGADRRPRSGLWRLNIDAAEQGRGYGRFAVLAVAEEIRRRGRQDVVTVTFVPGDEGPENFYLGLGFRRTGELSGDQAVAELDLAGRGPAGPER